MKQENKMNAPRGNVKMTASKMEVLSRTAPSVTVLGIVETNMTNALVTEILDVIVDVNMMKTMTSKLAVFQRRAPLLPSSKSFWVGYMP